MNSEVMRSKDAKKVTLVGSFVNLVLSVFKFIAGVIGKSSVMIADAAHSLSDFFTDIVVLFGFKSAAKPEDECHNYGHGKYETLAALLIGIGLIFVAYQILKSGILVIISVINGGILTRPGMIALIAAIISIIAKELLYRYTIVTGKKIDSKAVVANAWHHRSDAFSSVGVLLGLLGAMFLGENWTVLDPIASIIVSLFIFKVAYDILKPTFDELVEKSLTKEQRNKIINILKEQEHIIDYHKLRMRKVGSRAVIESHVTVDKNLGLKEAHEIVMAVEEKIKKEINDNSIVTLRFEPHIE